MDDGKLKDLRREARLQAYASVIRNSPIVIEEYREGAIRYLEQSTVSRRDAWDSEVKFTGLFSWSGTPQGHAFWSVLERKLDDAFDPERPLSDWDDPLGL